MRIDFYHFYEIRKFTMSACQPTVGPHTITARILIFKNTVLPRLERSPRLARPTELYEPLLEE